MLHPAGLAACTANFASWSRCLLRQFHLLSLTDPDAALLADEILAWPQIPPGPRGDASRRMRSRSRC
jgi:hypothetical protein